MRFAKFYQSTWYKLDITSPNLIKSIHKKHAIYLWRLKTFLIIACRSQRLVFGGTEIEFLSSQLRNDFIWQTIKIYHHNRVKPWYCNDKPNRGIAKYSILGMQTSEREGINRLIEHPRKMGMLDGSPHKFGKIHNSSHKLIHFVYF